MNKSYQPIVALVVLAAVEVPTLAAAQQHPAALGYLMTALVQPRHIKLGLAGNEQNWPYAAYELDQLRETFADLAEILPKYRQLSIPDIITPRSPNLCRQSNGQSRLRTQPSSLQPMGN